MLFLCPFSCGNPVYFQGHKQSRFIVRSRVTDSQTISSKRFVYVISNILQIASHKFTSFVQLITLQSYSIPSPLSYMGHSLWPLLFPPTHTSSSSPTLTRVMALCDTSCPVRGQAPFSSLMRQQVTFMLPRDWTVRRSPSTSYVRGSSSAAQTGHWKQSQSSLSKSRMSMTMPRPILEDPTLPQFLRCVTLVRQEHFRGRFTFSVYMWPLQTLWEAAPKIRASLLI